VNVAEITARASWSLSRSARRRAERAVRQEKARTIIGCVVGIPIVLTGAWALIWGLAVLCQ
jgi:hypothetical protein